MDSILGWANGFASFGVHYPDLVAILCGTMSGWCSGALAEMYFVPVTWTVREQKACSSLLTVFVSWLAAALMWGVVVPLDPGEKRWIVAGVIAPISPFTYVLVGRLLTRYLPNFWSVWAVPQEPKP